MSTYRKPNMKAPPETFTNCPEFLDRYIKYLFEFTGRSPATALDSFSSLREMLQYIHFRSRFHSKPTTGDAHKDLDISRMPLNELTVLTDDMMAEYLSFLEFEAKNIGATIYKKISAYRSFFLYIAENAEDLGLPEDYQPPLSALRFFRSDNNPVCPLSDFQVQQLINGCNGNTEIRDRAIITLLATVPLQLSELVLLKRKDVNLQAGTLRIVSDADTERVFLLPEHCIDTLTDYLDWLDQEVENAKENDAYHQNSITALFIAKYRSFYKQMTPRSVQKRINKAAEAAGLNVKDINAKNLRDTATLSMLRSIDKPNKKKLMLKLYEIGYASPPQVYKKFASKFPEFNTHHAS